MQTFTVIATGQTAAPAEQIEAAVRSALASVGVRLIPCRWAPDLDTIAENCGADFGSNCLVDLN